jgi:hypothetical protein
MNTKEKRDAITEYAKKQMLIDISTLGFPLMKTTDRFRINYNLHDDALQYVLSVYSEHGYMLTPIGVDLRNKKVMVLNTLSDTWLRDVMVVVIVSSALTLKQSQI